MSTLLKTQERISTKMLRIDSFQFILFFILNIVTIFPVQSQVDPNYKPNYQIKQNEKITWLNKTQGKLSYVTGIKGTRTIIIVSTDGNATISRNNGNSWEPANLPNFSNPIIKTFSVDTNNLYVAYYSGDLIKASINGKSRETLKKSGQNPGKDIFLINKNTGFIVGEMSLLRTINGGASWNYFPYTDGDKLIGVPALAAGNNFHRDSILACSATGRPIFLEVKLHGITFTDERTGFAVGETMESWGRSGKPVFLKTSDGGNYWEKQNFKFTNKALYGITFVNQKVGFISGYDGLLLKTMDAGITWDTIPLNKAPYIFDKINFLTESFGYITASSRRGQYGTEGLSYVLYTNNQGKTWQALDPKADSWQSVFTDFKNKILSELGLMPNTWESLYSVNNKTMTSVYSKMNNGTLNFKEQNIEKITALQLKTNGWKSLYFEDKNTIWAIDEWLGNLYKSSDQGNTWIKISTSNSVTNSDLNSVHFFNAKEGIITGNQSTILRTENSGANWKIIELTFKDENISNLFFVTSQSGFAMSQNYLFKTTNRGKTWSALPFKIPKKISFDTINFTRSDIVVSDVYFENEQKGFVYLTYSESSKHDCPPGRDGTRPCDPVGPQEMHLAAITINGGETWQLFKEKNDGSEYCEYTLPDGTIYKYWGQFYKSTDKRTTWINIWDPELKKTEIKFLKYADHYWGYYSQHIPTENFNYQFILDSTTRFIVGKQGRILKLEK